MNGNRSDIDYSFGTCLPSECLSDLYFKRDAVYYEVPFVNAACWLLSVDCVNVVGGFDTLLFQHFGEDNNYCQRMKYHGWRIIINMHCTICHDREYRKDRIGKNPLWDNINARVGLKVELGDITKSVELTRRIRTLRIRKLLSLFTFRFSKAQECDSFLKDCLLVEESREINMKPGLNWL